jgi:hypothetical protein
MLYFNACLLNKDSHDGNLVCKLSLTPLSLSFSHIRIYEYILPRVGGVRDL